MDEAISTNMMQMSSKDPPQRWIQGWDEGGHGPDPCQGCPIILHESVPATRAHFREKVPQLMHILQKRVFKTGQYKPVSSRGAFYGKSAPTGANLRKMCPMEIHMRFLLHSFSWPLPLQNPVSAPGPWWPYMYNDSFLSISSKAKH